MFSRRTAWNLAQNRYTGALEDRKRSGRELLDLTTSNPTTIGLNYCEEELLYSLANRAVLTYQPSAQGLLSARESVAAYYAQKGTRISVDDLILATSTSEAYAFVFRLLCDPGDAVLVPVPSYPLFDFLADLNDVRLIPYELVYDHGWQIDFESIHMAVRRAQAEGCRCRAALVVHPNNPTGSYVKPQEAKELERLCGAHDLSVIADEVFLDYQLQGQAERTFAANVDVLTFTLSGLSKIAALPQMKVAWLVASGPPTLKSEALARLAVIVDTYLSMSAPAQLALPTLLAGRRHIQQQILERVRSNLDELDAQLATQNLCRRLAIEGGWYAVLRVPALGSDEDLAIELLRNTGVLLHPGHFYNFTSQGFLVASLITGCEQFAKGIGRALQFIGVREDEGF